MGRRAAFASIMAAAVLVGLGLWVRYRGIRHRQNRAAQLLRRELASQGLPPDVVRRIADIYARPWAADLLRGLPVRARDGGR